MIVRPFRPYHVDLMRAQRVQDAQLAQVSLVPGPYANVPQPPGPAFSAFEGDNVIICGGVYIFGKDRGMVWALLSHRARSHMVWIHRATLRFLSSHPWRRLECSIDVGFRPGCRWVEMLGFQYEGEMPGFGDDGSTHVRYGRVST